MIFPRFTIRAILVVTTLCALVFVAIGTGYRGQLWGWGLAIGVLSLVLTALVHAACFGLVWCFARLSPESISTGANQPAPSAREDAP